MSILLFDIPNSDRLKFILHFMQYFWYQQQFTSNKLSFITQIIGLKNMWNTVYSTPWHHYLSLFYNCTTYCIHVYSLLVHSCKCHDSVLGLSMQNFRATTLSQDIFHRSKGKQNWRQNPHSYGQACHRHCPSRNKGRVAWIGKSR